MPTIEEAAQREAERHCAIMPVGLYEFMDMMHRINGDGYVCMLAPGLPFGAKLIGASFDFSRNAFLLKWLHPSFPRVIEGAELPYLKPAQIHVVDVPKSRIAQLMEKMEKRATAAFIEAVRPPSLMKRKTDALIKQAMDGPACQCGGEAAGTTHSEWCPKR